MADPGQRLTINIAAKTLRHKGYLLEIIIVSQVRSDKPNVINLLK